MGVEPTSETSCILNIPQAMDYIQHNMGIMSMKCNAMIFLGTKQMVF